ncbi:hypothetical protein [Streptococcus oriscaviae]|uniref:Gram-positive cocci surface proteins LPxTG domain-containing protein n=1 Tax=Streptococcus oriscaviae TaxID=2781599 RepID=A0ABX7YI78_9STRE|nr:hypothetical protein [Streptococcus oriscaviae]QUE53408.1 hypothetical protein INT76_05860 [Streptococcus oriscaviae]
MEIQKIQTLAVMQQFLDAITNTSPQQPPQIDPPKADTETPEQPKVSEQPKLPEQPKASEQTKLPEEPKASEQPKQTDTKGVTPKLATTKQLPRTGTRTDSILVKIGSILLAMLGISLLLSVGKRQGD